MMFSNLNSQYPVWVVVMIFGAFTACSPVKLDQVQSEAYPVFNPVVMDTSYTKEYVADIQAIQNIELRAKTAGYLENVHVDEGEFVKAGQLLFSINSKQYTQESIKAQASLNSAIAEARVSEVELNNVKILVGKSILAQSELDMAQAKYDGLKARIEESQADVENANLQLTYARIRAPFDGFINRIPNKAGSLIEEGTFLTSLSNNKEVYAYFNVSEKEYLDFALANDQKERSEVTLIMGNGMPHSHKGKIETIEGQIDKSTGNIAFRAKFPNPDLILKHGSSGKVQVENRLEKVMLIPQKTTFEIQGNLYVYVVTAENIVQMRQITPTIRLPHIFVVGSGLSLQDKVLFEGIQKVRDDQEIIPEHLSEALLFNL